MIVHGDNTGPYVATCATEYMDHNSLKRAPHPPYSLDITPSGFYLFRYLKHHFQGHEFTEGAELVSDTSNILNQMPTDTLLYVFDD
jgi:hypothetical protein